MAFTAIRTSTVEGVATITLARPDKLNAFTGVMHAELREALSAAEADDAVRCVVLTGEGRAFSAGQDLSEERIRGADGAVDVWFGGPDRPRSRSDSTRAPPLRPPRRSGDARAGPFRFA